MADEKLNVSPEENPQPSLFDTGPADAPAPETSAPEPPAPENIPEQAAVDAPAQDAPAGAPGEVSVSADQIEKLMAEQRAAERAEVEKNEPPEPEQPPTPAPEEKAAGEKAPAPEDKPKGRRGRKPKEEKAEPGKPGGTGARRGRPAKADKAATDRPPSPPRDKMSQSKGGKAATVKGKEEAPAAPAPEAPPQPRDATRAEKEEIVYLNLSELFPFKDHPFGVRDDAEMKGLVESVKDNGVHQPALVRPREGGGYEIIAGHRRQRASELAGFANMPCIVRNMTDGEAILAMTDDNLRHREKILPMEKAQSLKMQVEAISHQGTKMEGVTAGDVGKRSTEIVGERNGMNYKQVQRYIRLTELVPELQSMVNEKKLSFTPAVEISFIKPKNQRFIAVSIEGEQASPSLSQAQELRKLDKDGKLNGDVIDGILSREKKEVDKVIISAAELNKYFGKDATPREMKDQIMSLLAEWKEKQPPERTAPEKKTDREK
ncbi:ParB/RepB/Spo0J family partition protein [Acutalibacter muris]|uniref:DNA-binding protein n=1 Tax=Acutalibacter muris TaxID=1796620 RepID=A0A1Z2XMY8_9FIRM|nr:ParB/RepB/Spo0J family partition protein [Acutalibacter muris]ANU53515.1 DNA-binding protein [Hungateiclostridiaceae bacterium KB18]ASB39806.1 DNA-binding protein [Acutalibacter muris]QQR29097.1 ParB/RepB/Spo0J family partition protein [Acutalibacter muris]